jgi:cytochrome P450
VAAVLDLPFLDVADPGFSVRSAEVRAARELGAYARTSYGLAVLRYDEVARLIKDKRLIQGSAAWPAHVGVTGPWAEWWGRVVLNREGYDHSRLRKLMNPAFTSKAVTSLVPQFQEIANDLVDAFIERGSCEFMAEFSEPYATRVVARLLGIPEEEWRTLAAWSERIGLGLVVSARDHVAEMEEALEGLFGYADALIADRKRAPREDFVSHLVNANVERDSLSDEELRDSIVLLIFGGIDTTRNQIGLGVDLFMRTPEQWRLLAARPDLAANAVEEVMRLRPTVTWTTREATEDFEFDGIPIARGTTIHLFSESSGTDPLVVHGEPGLDIAAEGRPRHFGFGGGRHYCIGQFIARGDMGEALGLLARRLPDVTHDGEPTFLPDSGNTGPTRLPVRFTPGRRR